MKKFILLLISLLIIWCLNKGVGLSQDNPKEEKKPLIHFGQISFKLKDVESNSVNIKLLEIYIEILNLSRKVTASPNSIKLVLMPKDIKFLDPPPKIEWQIEREEKILDFPLPPSMGRIVVFGFSLPPHKIESITFEIQINPPEGDKKLIRWEEK